jgi:hypothetical protein
MTPDPISIEPWAPDPAGSDRESEEATRIVAHEAGAHADWLRDLGIRLDPHPPTEAFVLVERDGALDLRPPGELERRGIGAVFPPDRGRAPSSRHPLVRAFGRDLDRIHDLTAGLGADAYRLAAAGHRVLACERHPAVYAVLATGWARDCDAGRVPREVAERLAFRRAEGADVVAGLEGDGIGVYLDPMYPPIGRGKALPRRELQVLRRLLGPEGDAIGLVEAARVRAARVVVKRPHRAAPLVPGPDFEIASKLVRFDVYLNPARSRKKPADPARGGA